MATTTSATPVRLVLAWVLTVLTGGYLLPWAIAVTRGKIGRAHV